MRKAKINYIAFDTLDWAKTESSKKQRAWTCSDYPAKLSIDFFNIPPDIPVSMNAINELRDFYRTMVIETGGGIIKVETDRVSDFPILEIILKIPAQDTICYVGSITIPFKDYSYVIKIQAADHGITGVMEFPGHALTTVRESILQIKKSITFNKKLSSIEPFTGPEK
ncbi:MAG: hypothetical protein GY754_33590 [bacterium]|nr:hypothetical protein [bacterium]